jgi:type III pantothenate kinase
LPLVVDVEFPERVGIDRLLTAIAANRLRQPKQSAIVIDTGTAVTVDAIGSTGIFHGGAILPGVRMGAQALHRYTSTLPEIDASAMFSHTPPAIGRHTQEAIESGLYWGHVGAVRELILRQRDRLASFDKAKDAPSLLLFTGGAAPLLAPHFGQGRFEPHLALQGLAVVAASKPE